MALFREWQGSSRNSLEAILVSYDLQSGSYVEAFKNPQFRELHNAYTSEIAELVSESKPASVLEAGIGEATTLCSVLSNLTVPPDKAAGFDISWSRVDCARRHADSRGLGSVKLCTGDMTAIPFADNTFDVVYTAHAMEPNHGREREILLELYRVARHRVVLCEPSYELGGEVTRKRIEEHGYCRGLPEFAEEIGARVVLHRLFINSIRKENATAALVLEKSPASVQSEELQFACPNCNTPLKLIKENLFCEECLLVFPVISGIPCLLKANGILATRYPDNP